MNAMKQVIAKLETELHEKSTNNSFLEAEIRTMQRKLQMKDAEINRQSTELHKLRVTKFFHKHWGKRIFMTFFLEIHDFLVAAAKKMNEKMMHFEEKVEKWLRVIYEGD